MTPPIELAALIDGSPRLLSEADGDVMTKKYGKLLINLGNIADAACGISRSRARCHRRGDRGRQARVSERPASAGSSHPNASTDYKKRAETMQFDFPEGDTFLGGSTWQSLVKGAIDVGDRLLQRRDPDARAPARRARPRPTSSCSATRPACSAARCVPARSTPEQLDAEWEASLAP